MEQEDIILSTLRKHYQDREWFGEVGYDQFGRPVLYIKHECHETIWDVPDRWEGKQLMVHFLASHTARADSFFDKPQEKKVDMGVFKAAIEKARAEGKDTGLISALDEEDREALLAKLEPAKHVMDLVSAEEEEKQLELSVRALTDELDRLERLCGSNILQDIFYEVHDKTNAVTNLSAKFPEVRGRVERLYDKYGFDIIYEELDG